MIALLTTCRDTSRYGACFDGFCQGLVAHLPQLFPHKVTQSGSEAQDNAGALEGGSVLSNQRGVCCGRRRRKARARVAPEVFSGQPVFQTGNPDPAAPASMRGTKHEQVQCDVLLWLCVVWLIGAVCTCTGQDFSPSVAQAAR